MGKITENFNPFIDDTAWKEFLTGTINWYYETINKEQK